MKKEIIEWIKSIGIAIVIALIINSLIGTTRVYSVSMNPILVEKDMLILWKTKNINKGDIIVFDTDIEFSSLDLNSMNMFQKLKAGDTKNLVKRVIATEGDKLVIKGNKVYLNDNVLKEDYINENKIPNDIEIDKIPKGKIFVMGDNRDNSLDSRSPKVGLVDLDRVSGKVLYRIYPFNKIGKVR